MVTAAAIFYVLTKENDGSIWNLPIFRDFQAIENNGVQTSQNGCKRKR